MNTRPIQRVQQAVHNRLFHPKPGAAPHSSQPGAAPHPSQPGSAPHPFEQFGAPPPRPVLATIESIATGTPEHIVPQKNAAKVVANLPQMERNRSRIEKIYENTRIQTRHLALNLLSEEAIAFSQQGSIQARMQMYRDCAIPLAERVARAAIESARAGYPAQLGPLEDAIRLIVFVTSTGFVAPGVDAAVIEKLGLRRDIGRVTVNFMGCAAAMNGLRVASDHVRANPHHKALVICLELSSVNAVFEDEINDVIIHSIFGDGCAAVVVGACQEEHAIGRGKIVIRDHLSYLVENTADGITLGVQDNGITCKLSRQLPDYIESGLKPVIEGFLSDRGLTKADVDLWAIHPGGTRIIEKSQLSLNLRDDQVNDSWEVLQQYGNMLSASVLFVIERMMQRLEQDMPVHQGHEGIGWLTSNQQPPEKPITGIAFSFSPGVGIEGLLFQKV